MSLTLNQNKNFFRTKYLIQKLFGHFSKLKIKLHITIRPVANFLMSYAERVILVHNHLQKRNDFNNHNFSNQCTISVFLFCLAYCTYYTRIVSPCLNFYKGYPNDSISEFITRKKLQLLLLTCKLHALKLII